jgi:hypothetical protein
VERHSPDFFVELYDGEDRKGSGELPDRHESCH